MSLGGGLGQFGNEKLRYLVWDTCYSARISGGHSPWLTWGRAANGIRMLFGYETTSVDNGNYGRYFWEEWNKGKTLAQAFLDASWCINRQQTPVAVAFGASSTKAAQRRDGKRLLESGAVRGYAAAWWKCGSMPSKRSATRARAIRRSARTKLSTTPMRWPRDCPTPGPGGR